ncbi:ComC/BlpC family leader-containing pheromone/bacteriocin [uncultured Flavobacterium sp.]|nr:ComC/BlpC family leader-containing pheromone/bacteriocin [uncultured Flavobacterium sp.]
MKNKAPQTTNTEKTSNLKNFTSLSTKQLQTILGGTDPTLSRGTRTSSGD